MGFNQGGFRSSPRRDGPRRGGFRRDFGPREMHKAVCSECKKECEVPFKPTQGKPVFCRECFMKQRGITPRRSFGESDEAKPKKKPVEESEESESEEVEEESEDEDLEEESEEAA